MYGNALVIRYLAIDLSICPEDMKSPSRGRLERRRVVNARASSFRPSVEGTGAFAKK